MDFERPVIQAAATLDFNIESATLGSSLHISGWVFDPTRPISQVVAVASLGGQVQRIVALFPLLRPDVAESKDVERALLSGFSADGLIALYSAELSLDILYADGMTETVPIGSIGELLRSHQRPASASSALTPYPPLAVSDILERFDRTAPLPRKLSRPVDILVPVYRGREFIVDFFTSLLGSELEDATVTIIDDGNDDTIVAEYLQSDNLQRPDVNIIRKSQNEGFVLAVCTGFDNRMYRSDIVILNTDTILPTRWLPRLAAPLQAAQRIASTTPFTNAGTICSFPVVFQDNPPFLEMTTASIDAVFSRFDAQDLILELPTGVGFCMGMSMEAIAKIGFFDRVAFGRGYGEENDWSLRAEANDFKNTIVPNLYVHHKRGGSFTAAEKRELLARNGAVIARRYPHYQASIIQYQQANPLSAFRSVTSAVLACERYKFSPRICEQVLPSEGTTGPLDWLFNSDPVSICSDGGGAGRAPAIGIRVGSRVTSYTLNRPLSIDQLLRVFSPHTLQ
jgi:GT2 family glycosyltransferase